MAETLKIVVPMAGWGTRMRPHTWSKPKPLVGVAGRTALDYLLDMFKTIPNPGRTEYVFIVSPHLGETQIPDFMRESYPDLKVHYVVQSETKGQSHALYLAHQYLTGPMVMCFSDTLLETNFSFLDHEECDGVAWVKDVEDPRRFGVAMINTEGWIAKLIEKPQTLDNKRALVGCYYFRSAENLMAAIEEQMQRNIQLKNEFFLADAINIMLEHGALMRVETVEKWLDTGTIDATLETNRYLLENWMAEKLEAGQSPDYPNRQSKDVSIRPPVFIHETSQINNSTIGPYVSIGANCKIAGSRIEDSIIEAGCEIRDATLKKSMIGRQARIDGGGVDKSCQVNLGDNSSVMLG